MDGETVYSIKDWAETFETARSRKFKSLNWIALPVNFASNGYQKLLDEFENDFSRIYGAWCVLCAFAAQCPTRGKLADSKDRPIPTTRISRVTGVPKNDFDTLIRWATRPDVGWLECEKVPKTAEKTGQVTSEYPSVTSEGTSKEPSVTLPDLIIPDQTHSVISDETDTGCLFEEFWDCYPKPRKRDKAKARKAWQKAIQKKPPDQIIQATLEYAQSDLGSGDYSKLPATWLNGECWDDDRSTWIDPKKDSQQPKSQYKELNRRRKAN